MLPKFAAFALCLLGTVPAVRAQYLFISTPGSAGVSTGANTFTYTITGGLVNYYPGAISGTPVAGSFSGTASIDYTAASTAFPITITLPGGAMTGTITLLQNSFEDTNGNNVFTSTYGGTLGHNAQITITSGTGTYAGASGTFSTGGADIISVTCASGGTTGQNCPANLTAGLSIGGSGIGTFTVPASTSVPPAAPMRPGTLMLAAGGLLLIAWFYRRRTTAPFRA